MWEDLTWPLVKVPVITLRELSIDLKTQIFTFTALVKPRNFVVKNYINIMTVYYYHVTYVFQSESAVYSYLNVKELFARNRSDSDSNGIRTHNHLVRKPFSQPVHQTLYIYIYIYVYIYIYIYIIYIYIYIYLIYIYIYIIYTLYYRIGCCNTVCPTVVSSEGFSRFEICMVCTY